jgi:hypothetical protein
MWQPAAKKPPFFGVFRDHQKKTGRAEAARELFVRTADQAALSLPAGLLSVRSVMRADFPVRPRR